MDPKSVVRRFVEEFQTAGNLATAESLLASDFEDHTPFPGFRGTREGVLDLFAVMRGAFPDLRAEIHHQLAEGDLVATRKVFRGTHRGAFAGIAPTGRQVEIWVIDLVRVRDDRIAEHWNLVDQAGLMAQLQSAAAVLA